MIDLHFIHALSNGIKHYKSDRDAFREVFSDVAESYADTLFDKINTIDVKFDSAYSKNHESFPLITTSINESTSDQNQVLGNRGFNNSSVLFINQECTVYIYATDKDVLRVLHRLSQASLLLFKKSFLSSGYLNIEFDNSGDLEPDDDIIGKGTVVYGRTLMYVATRELSVKPIQPANFGQEYPWVLNPPNIT
jgi:hypothetical protein